MATELKKPRYGVLVAFSLGSLLTRSPWAQEGLGVDRHMFGLKNLAFHKQQRLPGYAIPAIFQDEAYRVLSASVLSTSNCGSDALTMFGFGPGNDSPFPSNETLVPRA